MRLLPVAGTVVGSRQAADLQAGEASCRLGIGGELGHGIGMEVHEPFDVSATDEVIVQEGMCFSIEPGIYIPGFAGVRIEDCGVLTKDGFKPFTHTSKELKVLPIKE